MDDAEDMGRGRPRVMVGEGMGDVVGQKEMFCEGCFVTGGAIASFPSYRSPCRIYVSQPPSTTRVLS